MSRDKPISVGDLVMVVRPLQCGCTVDVGLIFRVRNIRNVNASTYHCSACLQRLKPELVAVSKDVDDRYDLHPLSTLKRIPPLDELDNVKRDEGITA